MQRRELQFMEGVRGRFSGVFARYGWKPAYRGPYQKTILLTNVVDCRSTRIVADHLWLTVGKNMSALPELKPGNVISFEARVTSYMKGYRGRRFVPEAPLPSWDYRLSYPTHVQLVGGES